jgi:hypothetical protein
MPVLLPGVQAGVQASLPDCHWSDRVPESHCGQSLRHYEASERLQTKSGFGI